MAPIAIGALVGQRLQAALLELILPIQVILWLFCSGCRHRRTVAEFTLPGMKQTPAHLAG